ncbi:hypothetical protein BX070DRAFT_186627 [Coemansia spiralis]|nr:hypothetical protein BX070DRAFT_186627 [Coemansia spiralis]
MQQESNIVFLGNVAYDTTEEQLKRVLELAGPVVDVRLVFDPVTHRAKGYGFCQFVDINTAASAIKNLNDTEVDGRNIKIGYADRERVRRYLGTDGTTISGGAVAAAPTTAWPTANTQASFSTPFVKSIKPDQVDRLVDSLDNQQKSDLLNQFRSFANINTTKAREELTKNPALAHALLRSLEALNMIDPATLAQIRTENAGMDYSTGPGSVRQPSMHGSTQGSHMRHPPPPPPQVVARMPVPPPFKQQFQAQNHGRPATPSAVPLMSNSSMPPAAGTASQAPLSSSAMERDNAEVLKQLLSLTDEQLAQLPEDHRNQILDLKRQLEGV